MCYSNPAYNKLEFKYAIHCLEKGEELKIILKTKEDVEGYKNYVKEPSFMNMISITSNAYVSHF